jgi:hypothetical protein
MEPQVADFLKDFFTSVKLNRAYGEGWRVGPLH